MSNGLEITSSNVSRTKRSSEEGSCSGNSDMFCMKNMLPNAPWVEVPLTNFENYHVVQPTTELKDLKHVSFCKVGHLLSCRGAMFLVTFFLGRGSFCFWGNPMSIQILYVYTNLYTYINEQIYRYETYNQPVNFAAILVSSECTKTKPEIQNSLCHNRIMFCNHKHVSKSNNRQTKSTSIY